MFAKRLINLREQNNLYQSDLAKIFNVEQPTVSQWENGKRIPDSDMLIKIANYFGVSVDYLLGNVQSKSETEEIETLRQLLIKSGFMNAGEDLTQEQMEKLLKFVNANKEFLKGDK